MDLEEALRILRAMDTESTDHFTDDEEEAIITIGVAWTEGKITKEDALRLVFRRFDS